MTYIQLNPRPYEVHRLAIDLVPPGSRVLDIGCATGYIARELRKKSCMVIGVEKDPAATKVARRYCKNVIKGDLECPQLLPIPKHSFDVVLCLDVLEHLINRQELLQFIGDWLTAGGRLILSTPNIAHV